MEDRRQPHVAGGHLESVTAIAADDVWAVGASGYETLNLAEHWDGTSWTLVSVPNHEGAYNRLTGVSFGSAHQVLAVGAWYAGGGDQGDTVRWLWNGKEWREAPHSLAGILRIDAVSPTDAWAVGSTPRHSTLAKHWDGGSWRTVPTPKIVGDAELTHLSAISPTDVWATGQRVALGTSFLEHWNGSKWSIVDDAVSGDMTEATDISASGKNDVWVSGHTYTDGFLEHWDGTQWTEVPSPGGSRDEAALKGVSVASPNDAWSVGAWHKCTGGRYCYDKRIIQHWNGDAWTIYAKP